jgi:hypothetical protein
VLAIDAFRGHLSEKLKDKLGKNTCDLVVIPGGIRRQFQPLKVSDNELFKDNLRKEYEAWLLYEPFR